MCSWSLDGEQHFCQKQCQKRCHYGSILIHCLYKWQHIELCWCGVETPQKWQWNNAQILCCGVQWWHHKPQKQLNDAQMLYAECSSSSCCPDTYPVIVVLQQQLLPGRAIAVDVLEEQLFVWKCNGSGCQLLFSGNIILKEWSISQSKMAPAKMLLWQLVKAS